MSWQKIDKEYIWQDFISDIKLDILVISMTKTVIDSVLNKGYINDGYDLHRLILWVNPLIFPTREDLKDLDSKNNNKINKFIKFVKDTEDKINQDNHENLFSACIFLDELLVNSKYKISDYKDAI